MLEDLQEHYGLNISKLADGIIEVDQPMRPIHSGVGGGVVPDAFMVLSKIIASFHDEKGNLMIEGLTPNTWCFSFSLQVRPEHPPT